MNRQLLAVLVIIVAGVLAIVLFFPRGGANGEFDDFAKCLASKNITMYGADWCPHCQNEKRDFGSAFQFVPYVECPKDPNRCLAAGVEGYPTWVWPGTDGKKLVGEQGLTKLSAESGCALPSK